MDIRNRANVDWGNVMDTENRAFRLERCSNYARKTPRQAIQALRREIGSRGRDPAKGLSDRPNVPCRALGRRAAEYGAEGEDAFPGSGNPVANKGCETLKLKKKDEELRKEVVILKKKSGPS